MELRQLCVVIYFQAHNRCLTSEKQNQSRKSQVIDHFTVVCLVAWPLNESEAEVDLVLIETLLLFICKFLLISMRTASLT